MSKLRIQIPGQVTEGADLGAAPAADLLQDNPLYQITADHMHQGSITPRTLRSKTLLAIPVDGSRPLTSIEEYECNGNIVKRFAINEFFIQSDQSTNLILGEEWTQKTTPSVSGSTNAYTQNIAKNATLNLLEKDLITQAIRYLVDTRDRTVLVDIFERANGGPINKDEAYPIVHTVVLYKTASSIQVVDPSNFLYSSHLNNNVFNAELSASGLPQIDTIHKKIQIYKPEGSTGPNREQYRDCTDIAVKLAFGFNHEPIDSFTDAHIKQHPVVHRVTNNREIDKNIHKAVASEKMSVRTKQASSLTAEKNFSGWQSAIDQKLKACALRDPAENTDLKKKYMDAISMPSHIETLRALASLDKELIDHLTDQMLVEHQALYNQCEAYQAECAGQTSIFCCIVM